ncbi:MAG: lytic transglycosylase domain-containing protein, partial [Ramlibacter sp.]|nr:lytic transglycosylase domain-containing protein [Ramlibacter sp.]
MQATARWGGAGLLASAPWPLAWAGAQKEEHLADSVRTALSAAVRMSSAPPVPLFGSRQQELEYLRWLDE